MVLSFRAGCCFFLHIRVWPGAEGILPRPVGAFALYRHSSLHIWRNFRERDMGGQDPVRQSDGGDWPHFLLVVSVSLAVSGLLPGRQVWNPCPAHGNFFLYSALFSRSPACPIFLLNSPYEKNVSSERAESCSRRLSPAYSPFFCLDILEENTSHLMCLTGRKHICLKKGNGIL